MISHWILLCLLQTPTVTVEQDPPAEQEPVVQELPAEAPEQQEPESPAEESPAEESPAAESAVPESATPVESEPDAPNAEAPGPAEQEAQAAGSQESADPQVLTEAPPVQTPPPVEPATVAPQPPEASPAQPREMFGPVTGWQALSSVDLIINEECITSTDFRRALMSNRQPVSSEEEEARQLREVAMALISRQLKTQAGRDMGFDPGIIERYVADRAYDRKKRAGSVSRLADQLRSTDLDAGSYHEDIESDVLRQLWTGAVVGQYPGVGGRTFRDRFVRPRRLKLEFDRQEGRLDLPSTVTVQELVCDPVRTGSLATANELAVSLRQQILDGGDFGELAVANGAAPSDTMGMHKAIDEALLATIPGVAEFLESASPGDVSEVIPVRQEGVLRAWRVMRLVSRSEATVARFEDAEVQSMLRERFVATADKAREDQALGQLLDAAYVWPPRFFGRAEEPVQGAAEEPAPVDDAGQQNGK